MNYVIKTKETDFIKFPQENKNISKVDEIYGMKVHIAFMEAEIDNKICTIWYPMSIIYREYPINAFFTNMYGEDVMFFSSLKEFNNFTERN